MLLSTNSRGIKNVNTFIWNVKFFDQNNTFFIKLRMTQWGISIQVLLVSFINAHLGENVL